VIFSEIALELYSIVTPTEIAQVHLLSNVIFSEIALELHSIVTPTEIAQVHLLSNMIFSEIAQALRSKGVIIPIAVYGHGKINLSFLT